MVRVTVPIPGRSYDVVRRRGHRSRRSGALLPGAAGRVDRVRRRRPDGLRPMVRAARGVAGDARARAGAAHGSRRRGRQDPPGLRDAAAPARDPGGPPGRPRRSRWAAARWAISPASSPRRTCAACRSSRCRRRLLAQVDAAIGGKTAVNLPGGEEPGGDVLAAVGWWSPTSTPWSTLPEREFRSGLAEVAKYALTLDLELLETLERDPGPVLARDPATLERLVDPLRRREGPHRGRGRARRRAPPGPELRAHARPRARAARRVRRALARRGRRRRHGVRRAARRGARAGARRPRRPGPCGCSRRSGWRPTGRCRAPTTSSRRSGSTRSIEVVFASCSWRTSGGPLVVDDVTDDELREACCRRWERAYEDPLPVRSQPRRAGHARARRRTAPRRSTEIMDGGDGARARARPRRVAGASPITRASSSDGSWARAGTGSTSSWSTRGR